MLKIINHSGILRAKERLNSSEPDDLQEASKARLNRRSVIPLLSSCHPCSAGLTGIMVFMDFTRKFLNAGKKGIMSKHRMTAVMAAVALAGFMHALSAQENTDITPVDNASQQNTSELKPAAETPAPVTTTPAQALAQSNDKLLSEMKVYPSF
jgi:hypothetical protein